MTDTSYPLCPTCGREEVADICPACCGVVQQVEGLVDDILACCREKIGRAQKLNITRRSTTALTIRDKEDRRQEIADISWTLANLRMIKRQIGA